MVRKLTSKYMAASILAYLLLEVNISIRSS